MKCLCSQNLYMIVLHVLQRNGQASVFCADRLINTVKHTRNRLMAETTQ